MGNLCAWCVCSKFQCSRNEISCHYSTHHGEKYNSLQGQLKTEKINEMLAGLKTQKSVFTCSWEVCDSAVKASYPIASKIVSASKPYCEGDFVKTCMLKAAEIVCPENQQAFANISLSRITVAENFRQIWTGKWSTKLSNLLHFQLKLIRAPTLQMLLNSNYSFAFVMLMRLWPS